MKAQKLTMGTNFSPVLCPFLPNVSAEWSGQVRIRSGSSLLAIAPGFLGEVLIIDVTNNNYGSHATYLSGGISGGL